MNKEVEYVNVISDPDKLEEMLQYSGGRRKVPIIVDGESVIIGFQGKA